MKYEYKYLVGAIVGAAVVGGTLFIVKKAKEYKRKKEEQHVTKKYIEI